MATHRDSDKQSTHSTETTAHDDNGTTNEKLYNVDMNRVNTAHDSVHHNHYHGNGSGMVSSAGETRQEQYRLNDEMQFLAIERAISNQEEAEKSGRSGKSHSMRLARTRSRMRSTDEDAFNAPEPTPTFETPMMAEPETKVAKAFLGVKKLPRAIRYILYATPVALVLLVPVFLGLFTPLGEQAAIGGDGGVQLKWFGIWLEIVWLSLWAGRVIMTIIPVIMGFLGKAAGASTSRKWREIGRNLEIPFALFLWMLATMISFQPIVNDRAHRAPRDDPAADPAPDLAWARHIYKVIIAVFVLASMHVVEKVIIQWIASSFHRRTYSQRIETNKQSIAYLVHLYEYSKEQLFREDSIYENDGNGGSGAKTPMAALQKTARQVGNRVGDVAQRIKGDFTGQKIHSRNHPRKVVSELLRSSQTSQVLARRLFRTFAGGKDILEADDLNPAFPTAEDAEAAFMLFDRDLNGDVQCEELEAMCDEVHREKKAIAASLKDLDDVISKLDSTFLVIIVIIAIIVLITIISSSAATALTSAGSTILGLSWLLQATAQEFLQSIIFVFVKHPFDVGDRVTVYGNTGDTGAGDDYYVTAISLLYTEFKKMQGQIVQAPNSVLNTLFILNHRRSNGLADVNTLKMMFGTPESMIDLLKDRMTQFVKANKRDYGGQIITEMTGFEDSYAVSVNFIFFHKSSYQNELLRLTRHNRFACKLQEEMVAVGIEQPRRVYQISGRDFPLYNANIEPPAYTPPPPQNLPREPSEEMFPTLSNTPSSGTNMNNSRESRMRAGSNISITLNDQTVPQGMDFQDVFDSRGTANINPALVRPIGSIRQMERRNHHPEPIMEDAGEGSALNQLNSGSSAATSNRKRMFGGPRRSMTWSKRNTSEDIV